MRLRFTSYRVARLAWDVIYWLDGLLPESRSTHPCFESMMGLGLHESWLGRVEVMEGRTVDNYWLISFGQLPSDTPDPVHLPAGDGAVAV